MQGIKWKTNEGQDNSCSCIIIKKERHVVTWSREDDDILREQIGLMGTDRWTMIASRFKDKTPRQCRRRWYTYLNSDFKRGGWTPEEDVLLCEAQKMLGNRWTEIAKVVSGRTDNAVKNRFTTLRKKRARYDEALAKENNFPFINSNNKSVTSSCNSGTEGTPDDVPAPKRERLKSRGVMETYNLEDRFHVPKKATANRSFRCPFEVLVGNIDERDSTKEDINTVTDNEDANKIRGTFLSKDDPKVAALMQQAALFSSLALKVNEESTDQTRESAWKVLEDFLNRKKEVELDKENALDLRDLLKGLRSIDEGANFGKPELCDESSVSSECSTGSTAYRLPVNNQTAREDNREQPSLEADDFQSHKELIKEVKGVPDLMNEEFGSPPQVTPLFRSLAAGIPSPKFSETERNFIMKTLGMESPSIVPSNNPPRNPACKRALLHHL